MSVGNPRASLLGHECSFKEKVAWIISTCLYVLGPSCEIQYLSLITSPIDCCPYHDSLFLQEMHEFRRATSEPLMYILRLSRIYTFCLLVNESE
ncbi:hypothetical protein FKM82_009326 [Ascaphus truei]